LSRHSADLTGTTIRTAAQKTGTRRTWVSLGYLAGNHIDAIYHDITRYSYYLLIALPVVLAAYIARHTLPWSPAATCVTSSASRTC
jgi:hypothetical protein